MELMCHFYVFYLANTLVTTHCCSLINNNKTKKKPNGEAEQLSTQKQKRIHKKLQEDLKKSVKSFATVSRTLAA